MERDKALVVLCYLIAGPSLPTPKKCRRSGLRAKEGTMQETPVTEVRAAEARERLAAFVGEMV
ncbi:MAG: hypothetical protein KKA32_07585, partial [Actinobacteria bacterium]|nr:hypothetical protein [Actinomycetota bacterium]